MKPELTRLVHNVLRMDPWYDHGVVSIWRVRSGPDVDAVAVCPRPCKSLYRCHHMGRNCVCNDLCSQHMQVAVPRPRDSFSLFACKERAVMQGFFFQKGSCNDLLQ